MNGRAVNPEARTYTGSEVVYFSINVSLLTIPFYSLISISILDFTTIRQP